MTATSAWDALVPVALVGTDRREAPRSTGPLAGLLEDDIDTGGAAGEALAAQAGAAWTWEQAGFVPPAAIAVLPPAAPVDDRPLLSPAAIRALDAILGDARFRPLLPEWLTAAAGCPSDGGPGRIPPEWLPDLAAATADSGLEERSAFRRLAGPRLEWLARRRPEWRAHDGAAPALAERALAALAGEAAAGPPEELWVGADPERIEAFLLVRRADPSAARRLARWIWDREPGTVRSGLVEAFASGLSDDDEGWLERCLDERRRAVRLAAAELLARLPASQYCSRMAERARPLVRRGGRRGVPLTISPPSDPDRTALRDGVPAGDPSAALTTIVAATPLGCWETWLGGSGAELVGAGLPTPLLAGWMVAAARQGDHEWAVALSRPEVVSAVVASHSAAVAGIVAPAAPVPADDPLPSLLAELPLTQLIPVLLRLPGPWSPAASRAFLAGLAGALSAPPEKSVLDALPALGRRISADKVTAAASAKLMVAMEAAPVLAGARWSAPITGLVALVHFRTAMHEALV